MGKITGFLDYPREVKAKQEIKSRIKHYSEFTFPLSDRRLKTQTGRCMDCGVPFCNGACPIYNLIPEFNDLVYNDQWKAAYEVLQSTNNFPEFTGRICPAPCEPACCAGVVTDPVSICTIEHAIIEKAFEEGWVKVNTNIIRNDIKIAIIGSGSAGLAAAQQLNSAGYHVTVFEKNEAVGGITRFGIPDFKLEKWVIQRRVKIMEEEGIDFTLNCNVGVDYTAKKLLKNFDFICLTGGAEAARDLVCENRNIKGIHLAMDFLTQQNRINSGTQLTKDLISVKNKNVVVIGGGDTGSDCVGTSIRQRAASVTQLEILPKPPRNRSEDNQWPEWPRIFTTSSSQEEGCERMFSVITKALIGEKKLEKIRCSKAIWFKDHNEQFQFREKANSEFELEADLILLAMGFTGVSKNNLFSDLGVEITKRGNVKAHNFKTTNKKVFTAGDMMTGQSLVVRAINSGREMAKALDTEIKGYSNLL
jgi:glutamate synthase (NADPH) small chain